MKKLFTLLLVAAMCFSLVACGGDKTSNNAPQNLDESQNEDVSESNREPQKVELTLDNWSKYFDIVGKIETSTYPNGEEKPDYIYYFVPKNSNIAPDNIGVTVRIDCDIEKRYYVTGENSAIVWSETEYAEKSRYTCDSSHTNADFSEISPFKLICGADVVKYNTKYSEEFETSDKPVMFVPTNITVFEIYGTISIK